MRALAHWIHLVFGDGIARLHHVCGEFQVCGCENVGQLIEFRHADNRRGDEISVTGAMPASFAMSMKRRVDSSDFSLTNRPAIKV